jgi:hypothetical protein
VAKAGANITPPEIARILPLVPLGCALDCLHNNDIGALTRAASHRRYDRKTLDGLLERLVRLNVRARGNVDRAPQTWIESSELLDYQIGYMHTFAPGHPRIAVARLESLYTYPAAEVKNHGAPVRHPASAEPYYRRIVNNLKIETEPLLRALSPQRQIPADENGGPVRKLPNKLWITGYVERRRTDGDLPKNITEFSRQIERNMCGADDCDRPLKVRTIENRLRDWKLWPVRPAK